jgi:hypothetical protein
MTTAQIDLHADLSGCMQAVKIRPERSRRRQTNRRTTKTIRAEPHGRRSSGDTKKWKALRKHTVLSQTNRPISYVTGEQIQTSVKRIHVSTQTENLISTTQENKVKRKVNCSVRLANTHSTTRSDYVVQSYTTNLSFIRQFMKWTHVHTSSHSTVGYDRSYNNARNLLLMLYRAN